MGKKDDSTIDILTSPGKKLADVLTHPISSILYPLNKNNKDSKSEKKESTVNTQVHNNISWTDIENPTSKEINKLEEEHGFHYLYLQTSLLKNQLPQLEKEDKYLFIVIHFPSFDSAENKIITNQLKIFLGKNYLITIHEDSANQISELFKLCDKEKEYQENYFKKTSGYLLYSILSHLIKNTSSLTQMISKELDEIEDIVFDLKSAAYSISQLRQKIVKLRRILGSWKKILEDLPSLMSPIIGDSHSRYYASLTRENIKLREAMDEVRETVEIYQDADFIVSSEKTNDILGILTIIFTLTIPATVVGTFYGMNVLIPGGVQSGSWTFLGPYTTFIIIISTSVLLFGFLLIFFKIKKWF